MTISDDPLAFTSRLAYTTACQSTRDGLLTFPCRETQTTWPGA